MHSKITKIAVVAAILLSAILSLTLFEKTTPSAYAIEQTLEAMHNLRTMHLFGKNWGNHEYEMWIQLNSETGMPDYIYADYYTRGHIAITRPDTSYQYNKHSNTVLVNSGRLYHVDIAPAKIFEQLLQMSHTESPGVKINMYHEFDKELDKTLIVVLFDKSDESRRIFIDPETKLPVRILGLKGLKLGAVFKDLDHIEFDVDLPEGIFDFEVTDDMQVVDMDRIMNLVKDPQYGMSSQGMTEQEAASQIATAFWKAVIAQDADIMKQLAPTGTMSSLTTAEEIVEIGQVYIQPGVGIGKVIPCKLRFTDGSIKQAQLIVRFRHIDDQPSCVIVGTSGGMLPVE